MALATCIYLVQRLKEHVSQIWLSQEKDIKDEDATGIGIPERVFGIESTMPKFCSWRAT